MLKVKVLEFKSNNPELQFWNKLIGEKGRLEIGKAFLHENRLAVEMSFAPFDPDHSWNPIHVKTFTRKDGVVAVESIYGNSFKFGEVTDA